MRYVSLHILHEDAVQVLLCAATKSSFHHLHAPACPALTLIYILPMLPVSKDPRFHPYHLSCRRANFIPFLSQLILDNFYVPTSDISPYLVH